MRKLKILTVAVMTLTLTFTSTVQSNASYQGKNILTAGKKNAFGGRCQVILARMTPALKEVKALKDQPPSTRQGYREALRRLSKDLETYTADVVNQKEVDLLEITAINSGWIVDYFDWPDKLRLYSLAKVKSDFLKNSVQIQAKCK